MDDNLKPVGAVKPFDIVQGMHPQERGPTQHVNSVALKQFSSWKQKIIEEMLKDDELMKLISYPIPDFVNQPEVTEDERFALVNKRIYPYRFIDRIEGERQSFISMEFAHWQPFEGFRIFSEKFAHGYVYFYMLSDVGIMDTNYGVRQDLILARIYDIFEGYRGLGVGEMKQESQLPLWPDNNSYGGYTLGFRVVEYK